MTRDIEQFAIERLNLVLTPYQLEVIDALASGKVLVWRRQAGYSTAKEVLQKYVQFQGEYIKHFKNVHYRAMTAKGEKFVYCPVGRICSWSEGDWQNKWCHWCKQYFSEIKE